MDLSTITVDDFKARFRRDFSFKSAPTSALGTIPDQDFVQDDDITFAFSEAQFAINQGLFTTDDSIKTAYLFLSAHLLALNITAAESGINSPAAMPVNARNVGSVSESYSIPEQYLKDPLLATYTQTSYGLKYLAMALPGLRGNMVTVCGGTNP